MARSSGAGSAQEADQDTAVERLCAPRLTNGGDRPPPRDYRVESIGEVAERVIAEALGKIQGPRTPQRFNRGEGREAHQDAHQQSPQQGGGWNAPFCAAIAR